MTGARLRDIKQLLLLKNNRRISSVAGMPPAHAERAAALFHRRVFGRSMVTFGRNTEFEVGSLCSVGQPSVSRSASTFR
ncbi:hypothetical protein ACU4GD_46095 [Cupriavidus basilensis]